MTKDLHVVPHDAKWAVRGGSSSSFSSVHDTQREAIEAARRLAEKDKGQLFIHGRDGRIRDHDSYAGVYRKIKIPTRQTKIGRDRIKRAVWNASKG